MKKVSGRFWTNEGEKYWKGREKREKEGETEKQREQSKKSSSGDVNYALSYHKSNNYTVTPGEQW